jgi:hypothetical protein
MDTSRLRRIVSLLTMVGVVVFPACGGGDNDEAAQASATTAATQPESTTTTTAPGPDQTPKEIAFGTPVTVGNVQVIFHGATIPYTPTGRFDQPIPGTIVAVVDTEDVSPDVALLDNSNRLYDRVSSGIQPEAPRGQIAAGLSKRGLFVFQLLDGAQGPGLRLLFLPDSKTDPAYVLPLVPGGNPPAPPSAGPGDPAKTYAKGEAAGVGWGTIVVHGVVNPAQPSDPQHDAPEPGFHFVVLDVELFNTSKQTQNTFDLEAKLKESMNQSFSTTPKRTKESEIVEKGLRGSIPAGMGIRGPVTFMMPDSTAAGPLTLLVTHRRDPPIMFAVA